VRQDQPEPARRVHSAHDAGALLPTARALSAVLTRLRGKSGACSTGAVGDLAADKREAGRVTRNGTTGRHPAALISSRSDIVTDEK
jgi:hypothetical protein